MEMVKESYSVDKFSQRFFNDAEIIAKTTKIN
jgi:hypothetical protein